MALSPLLLLHLAYMSVEIHQSWWGIDIHLIMGKEADEVVAKWPYISKHNHSMEHEQSIHS